MVQVVTGDSQEEVIIFRYRHTNRHCIIIYISSSQALCGVMVDIPTLTGEKIPINLATEVDIMLNDGKLWQHV